MEKNIIREVKNEGIEKYKSLPKKFHNSTKQIRSPVITRVTAMEFISKNSMKNPFE